MAKVQTHAKNVETLARLLAENEWTNRDGTHGDTHDKLNGVTGDGSNRNFLKRNVRITTVDLVSSLIQMVENRNDELREAYETASKLKATTKKTCDALEKSIDGLNLKMLKIGNSNSDCKQTVEDYDTTVAENLILTRDLKTACGKLDEKTEELKKVKKERFGFAKEAKIMQKETEVSKNMYEIMRAENKKLLEDGEKVVAKLVEEYKNTVSEKEAIEEELSEFRKKNENAINELQILLAAFKL